MEEYEPGDGKRNSKEFITLLVIKVPNHLQYLFDYLTKTPNFDTAPIVEKLLLRSSLEEKMITDMASLTPLTNTVVDTDYL